MKAVVLAGGLGTRLHPLTVNIPKPMVPVANRPLMEYIIELLAKHKFKDISVLLYHQPESIKSHFKTGKEFGVNLQYIEAPENYGTAGAVKYAVGEAKEPFLVISADLITDFNLKEAVEFHSNKKSNFTVVLTRVPNPLPYGIVITNKDGRIKHFLEKPSWSEVFSDTINTGIYIIDPEIIKSVPEKIEFDFSNDLFPILLEKKEKLYGYIAEGTWKDIGSIEEYGKSHFEILRGTPFIKEADAVISKSADLQGAGIVGESTVIGDEAKLINCVIGDNCTIGRGVYLREVVVWNGTKIGNDVRMERAIVCRNSYVGDRSYIEEHAVVGDEVRIGPDSTIRPHVKIWPGRMVEEGSTVSRSLVFRDRFPKTIFGPFGVTGLLNIEITPEFASSLGAAFGALLGKGGLITTSRDSHKASRMIYRSLLSGVLSMGVNVSDLEMTPIPVTRYELMDLKSQGGFHVRKSPYDPEVIDIKFFDDDGMELRSSKEKKIERLFFAEDFKRLRAEEIGELSFPFHRVAEKYKEGVLHHLDIDRIKSKRRRVVIDYANGAASQIFPAILGELGIEVVSLNAFIDVSMITKSKEEFDRSLKQLSTIVKSLEADLGVMFDSGAEKIFITDEKGNVFSGKDSLLLVLSLVLNTNKKAKIAIPVDVSTRVETIASKYGAKVIRTKTSYRHMMEIAAKEKVAFLGDGVGGYIFPDFKPHFDAMYTTAKLIELMNSNELRLSQIEIPQSKFVKKDISCAMELKGKVIRTLSDELKEEDIDLTDGIKVKLGEDWILVLPHPTKPVIELYAESEKLENAKKMLSNYTKHIDEILG